MTNKEKYKKAFDVLASSEQLSLEVNRMKNNRVKKSSVRKVAAVFAVCMVLAGTGTGVYAAVKHFGILDFSNTGIVEVPQEAQEQIQKEPEVVQEKNDTIYECSVKEALCDSETIMLVYEVRAKESNKYLFIPEDALPEDSMRNWGYSSDMTAQEYATQNGLTIVNIGGGITNRDDLGIAEASMDFISVSDDIMDVFIRCGVTESSKTREIGVVATGRLVDSEDVMRLESTFELQDMSSTTVVRYACSEDTNEDSFYQIERAEVIQTDLGTYVDVYYSNDNGDNPEDGLTFRVIDPSGTEYPFLGGSGVEYLGENHYKERCIIGKSEIGETLNIQAFDCFEKTVYGVTQLNKE